MSLIILTDELDFSFALTISFANNSLFVHTLTKSSQVASSFQAFNPYQQWRSRLLGRF